MARLVRFIDEINDQPSKRWLMLGVLTLVTVYINGYHFGTFDQVFHIPFLKVWANPSLYPNDAFVGLKDYHFSYFWFMFLPFYNLGILEPALFIVHLLVTVLTFHFFWQLCDMLFHNHLANFLLSIALVFPHIGFPGFQIIEFSLLNRTFAIPFLIWAITLYLRKQYGWSFLLIGLMFDIHLVYASFVLAMFGMDLLLRIKQIEWRRVIPAMIVFIISITPLLLRKNTFAPGFDFSLRPELRDMEALSTLFTVYYPIGKIPYVWASTLQGVACVLIIIITMRLHPSKHDQIIRNFLRAIGVVVALGSIASYWLPITVIIQFQLIRIGVFLLYLTYIYLAYLTAETLRETGLGLAQKVLITFSALAVIFPVVPLIVWALRNHFGKVWRLTVSVFLAIIMITLEVGVAAIGNYLAPGFHIYGPKSEWQAVQEWAKMNTPTDALFITPPYEFWHYESDWRVFSERGTVATLPEFMVLHLKPAFLPEFVDRFDDLAPGVISILDGDYNHTFAATKAAFSSLTSVDFVRIGKKYSADYLVLPVETQVTFENIYKNSEYTIYRLP